MADNLNITIGADTSKARHEMALLDAQIRKTNKEIKTLSDEAVKTGDPKAVAGVKTLTAAVDGMTRKLVVLKKETTSFGRELNKVHEGGHAHKFYLVENSVQSLNGAFMALGHNLAGARAGIAGFVVGIGFQELIKQINEADQRLRDVRELGREIGQKPLVTQAVQELAKETGESAEAANKFLQGMGATLAKIATQASSATGQGILDGVMRGGAAGPRDFSDPLAVLGSSAERLRKMAPEQQMKTLGELFLRLQRNARSLGITELQLNEISKSWFSVSAEAANDLIKANANLLAKQKELSAAQRGANAQHLKEVQEVDKAYAELGKTIENIWGGLGSSTAGGRAGFFRFLDQWLKDNIELLSNWSKALGIASGSVKNFLGIGSSQEGQVVPLAPVDVTAKALPQLFRGPSSASDTSGHGPASIGGAEAGHGPGARVKQAGDDLQAATAKLVQPTLEAVKSAEDAAGSSKTAAQSAADAAAAAQSAADASRQAVQAWVDRPVSALGLASGGMIHGPGSGTSDSITARLSNGEFVMSAKAVSHWGPGLMAALNGLSSPSFSGGGMPRFAEGGLVAAAGGGTPVHLHLDGQAYAMHAESGVAQALVVAAQRQQMRSAGVKPSWYGGRPGA